MFTQAQNSKVVEKEINKKDQHQIKTPQNENRGYKQGQEPRGHSQKQPSWDKTLAEGESSSQETGRNKFEQFSSAALGKSVYQAYKPSIMNWSWLNRSANEEEDEVYVPDRRMSPDPHRHRKGIFRNPLQRDNGIGKLEEVPRFSPRKEMQAPYVI